MKHNKFDSDFSDAVLLFKERLFLFESSFKPVPQNKQTVYLFQHGLLDAIYANGRDRNGARKFTGKYRISERGKRYLRYTHKEWMRRFLTPIAVSVITSVITNIALQLLSHWQLQEVLNSLMGLQ